MKSTVLCVASAIVCSALFTRAESASGMICLDPVSAILWKTVPGTDPEVQLDWPDGAVRAVIYVDGVALVDTADTSKTSCAVPLELPEERRDERVRLFEVVYSGGSGTEIRRQSALLGHVLGTSGREIAFVASTASPKWEKVEGRRAVLKLPEGSGTLTVDGAEVGTPEAPGWYELDGITVQGNSVTLACRDETVFEAWVRRVSDGLRLLWR